MVEYILKQEGIIYNCALVNLDAVSMKYRYALARRKRCAIKAAPKSISRQARKSFSEREREQQFVAAVKHNRPFGLVCSGAPALR